MNSFVAKAFVLLTEIGYWIVTIAILLVATYTGAYERNLFVGVAIAVGGVFITTVIFGFAAIFIEIHKDLRKVRERLES